MTVYPGEAELEMVAQGQSFRWLAGIRFGPAINVLLGQLGCLEFFTATFDHYRGELTLEPNELYPGLLA